jgi:PadR family transcriptional regulator
VTELYVLLALAAGRSPGFAILVEVDRLSSGEIGPAALYRTLDKMAEAGLIQRVDEADDERRSVYEITRRGRERARAEAKRLDALLQVARTRKLLTD